MVQKITKYLKFVVCCALIMSLVAPSYAALSASDGSAFVTKAEFDSALADFNARLTTFEAGINSKIDSQVSSYLDRNGIWNGKEQVINALYKNRLIINTADMTGTTWSELTNKTIYKHDLSSTVEWAPTGTGGLSLDHGTHLRTLTRYWLEIPILSKGKYWQIVDEINKSGLLTSYYALRLDGQLQGGCYWYGDGRTTPSNDLNDLPETGITTAAWIHQIRSASNRSVSTLANLYWGSNESSYRGVGVGITNSTFASGYFSWNLNIIVEFIRENASGEQFPLQSAVIGSSSLNNYVAGVDAYQTLIHGLSDNTCCFFLTNFVQKGDKVKMRVSAVGSGRDCSGYMYFTNGNAKNSLYAYYVVDNMTVY